MNTHTPEFWHDGNFAILRVGEKKHAFAGHWVEGSPWERFGRYDSYVVLRSDGGVIQIHAHAGELVPGSTEDLVSFISTNRNMVRTPASPLTLELDPTYACVSIDCGSRCFSAPYRRAAPMACIPPSVCGEIIRAFSDAGGRIVRFDGGGDPLCHPDVRNGRLPVLAQKMGLKSTILTSGDLLSCADLQAFVDAQCYVRVSLNAATQTTREAFHGNTVQLSDVCHALEELALRISKSRTGIPLACTFLLDTLNMEELLPSAVMAKSLGINHFSVRRVLGPDSFRPVFSSSQLARLPDLFSDVGRLESESFQVFLPWRKPNESDLNPSCGDFFASHCWQSTLKTVVEPDPGTGGIQGQLCGRYRGCGIGQKQKLPPLFQCKDGRDWVALWRRTFEDNRMDRQRLPKYCVSCIDRGFIKMLDDLMAFLSSDNTLDFNIFHLKSRDRKLW